MFIIQILEILSVCKGDYEEKGRLHKHVYFGALIPLFQGMNEWSPVGIYGLV